jgi:lipopolysaccharide assembly protein A
MKMDAILPKIKLIALLALSVVGLVLVLQNTQRVVTRLLFVTIDMPLAALLALTLFIGFAGGVLTAMTVGKSR